MHGIRTLLRPRPASVPVILVEACFPSVRLTRVDAKRSRPANVSYMRSFIGTVALEGHPVRLWRPARGARLRCSYSNYERFKQPRSVADILKEQANRKSNHKDDDDDELDEDEHPSMEPTRPWRPPVSTSRTARRQPNPWQPQQPSQATAQRAAREMGRSRRQQDSAHDGGASAPFGNAKAERGSGGQAKQAYMSPALVKLLSAIPEGKELTDRY